MTSTFVNTTLVPGTGISGSFTVCFIVLLLLGLWYGMFDSLLGTKAQAEQTAGLVRHGIAAATSEDEDEN